MATAKSKTAKAAKAATPKPTRPCLCGCGGKTASNFVPGHDARMHGVWLRVQRGEQAKGERVTPEQAAYAKSHGWRVTPKQRPPVVKAKTAPRKRLVGKAAKVAKSDPHTVVAGS